MNSIVALHLDAGCHVDIMLYAALDRLGAYIGEEVTGLNLVLSTVDPAVGETELNGLTSLHLDANAENDDVRDVLASALRQLEKLLVKLKEVPTDFQSNQPVPSDFDAALLWHGARIDDMILTIRFALDQ